MSKQEPRRRRPPTPPSEAVGEAGDQEARRAADEAVTGRVGETAPGDSGGHTAKRQRPGTGREEQVRPHQGRADEER